MNALLTVDSDLWNRADALKSDALRRDIRSNNAYWKQYATPVSEDAGMIHAATEGYLDITKLESMTAVCSVGLDMIVVPGDITPEVISAIIADEAAIGMVNTKTTAVRLIPAIGKSAGEELNFGGLLGRGPVMPVRKGSPEAFIKRGGRIPAPLQALKN